MTGPVTKTMSRTFAVSIDPTAADVMPITSTAKSTIVTGIAPCHPYKVWCGATLGHNWQRACCCWGRCWGTLLGNAAADEGRNAGVPSRMQSGTCPKPFIKTTAFNP